MEDFGDLVVKLFWTFIIIGAIIGVGIGGLVVYLILR